MAGRLTKRRVDAAKPGETIWDGEIPGFGLRASRNGAKSFVFKYRIHGRQRWLTVGRYGAETPDSARVKAIEFWGAVKRGDDPARNADTGADKTVAEFAKLYEEFSETGKYRKRNKPKKPTSRAADRFHLKNHIIPNLGSLRMNAVTKRDVEQLHGSLFEKPYAANRVLALLSNMYAIAAKAGVVPEGYNPATGVEKNEETGRERFLSPAELRRLGRVLAFLEQKGAAPYAVAAIRLLLFTGARLNEVLKLRWDEVDLEARVLRLPDSKTGKKTIALPSPAMSVLDALNRNLRQAGNPYVICGSKTGAHLVNLQKPWGRIRKAALIKDVRIHDLRHSFASMAVAGGMSLPLIGSLLGHTQATTTQRYAHVAADPRLAAADKIASEIAASLSGGGGEVIPLRKSAKDNGK